MSVRLEADLLGRLSRRPGDVVLVVRGSGPGVALAVEAAAAAVRELAHPDEPGEPWANSARTASVSGETALVVDFKDWTDVPGLPAVVVGALVAALAGAGTDAVLALPLDLQPEAAAAPASEDEDDLDDEVADEAPVWVPAHTARLLRSFPWPSDLLPVPDVLSPLSCHAFVPRGPGAVEDELVASLSTEGQLLGRGRLHGQDGGALLISNCGGAGWCVVIRSEGSGSHLSVTSIDGSTLTRADQRALVGAATWTVTPWDV